MCPTLATILFASSPRLQPPDRAAPSGWQRARPNDPCPAPFLFCLSAAAMHVQSSLQLALADSSFLAANGHVLTGGTSYPSSDMPAAGDETTFRVNAVAGATYLRLSLALMLALAQLPHAHPQAVDCEDARYCDGLLGRYDCDTDVGAFVSAIPEGTLKQEVCPSTCEVPACAAGPPPPPPVDSTTVDPTTGAAPPWVPLQGVPRHSYFTSNHRPEWYD